MDINTKTKTCKWELKNFQINEEIEKEFEYETEYSYQTYSNEDGWKVQLAKGNR